MQTHTSTNLTLRLGRQPSHDEIKTIDLLSAGATWKVLERQLGLRSWTMAMQWTYSLFARLGFADTDHAVEADLGWQGCVREAKRLTTPPEPTP